MKNIVTVERLRHQIIKNKKSHAETSNAYQQTK
jgi:hypothetical protein